MASKKRKTIQIKRPEAGRPQSKKKTLPKVNVDDASATSAIDTDELKEVAPKTAKLKRPDSGTDGAGVNPTRIQLPDGDKLRKARQSPAPELDTDAPLPNAQQLEQAEKNATMPIMIDQDDVQKDTDAENIAKAAEAGNADTATQTLKIDDEALATGKIPSPEAAAGQDLNSATVRMATQELPTAEETDLTVDKMKESFNAMTMAMDTAQISEEISGETMDLTEERPKTIMIKRPAKPSPASPPTVKAVRPDAATIKARRPAPSAPGRPVTLSKEPKEEADTDVKEGKTIKLRRPDSRGSQEAVSRYTAGAGLQIDSEGKYVAAPKVEEPLSAGWTAVAVLTLLVSLSAVWMVCASHYPQVPMVGRIVDANNTVLPYIP